MARVELSPLAAIAGWVAVLVTLNLTSDPLVCAATFAGLALLAWRTRHRALLVLSLVTGVGLLLLVPGVAVVDGSFAITYGNGAWRTPQGVEWFATAGSALRVPAQVLAATLLLLVQARLLLAAAGRLSPGTALLGGLAARLRPLLARDVQLVRDELASRGLRLGRGAPLGERARSVVALWEALVSGLLDRAFQTAAALETRGFGVGRPTTAELVHPDLSACTRRDRAVDGSVGLVALVLVASVIAGRATGVVQPPSMQVVVGGGAVTEPSVPTMVLGLLGLALGCLPLTARARTRIEPGAAPARSPMTDSGVELEVRDVSMHYPTAPAPAITGVSLRVAPGELVVVTGASGSGKSTLLDVVTGVAPRATGGVRRGSVRLGRHVLDAAHGAARLRVVAVFQDPEAHVLVGDVAEEVAFGLRHAGHPVPEIERRVLAVLDQLGIRHLAQRDCATLSGGELQRVLLAAALVLDPALLVLDEPTSQVDATSERRFWDAVDDARRTRGIGVIAAEHRLDHVLARADRLVEFAGGHLVLDAPVAAALEQLPHLRADAYAGLAPTPVATTAAARLQVQIDRLDVESRGAAVRPLLRGLGFSVPGGSIVTLEGPNGTGKSTLLRAIRGLHGDHHGVAVDGRRRGEVGDSARSIAFLSQGAGALLPGRTVRHAIEDTCRRLGLDVAAAHTALAAAGLGGRIDSHPSELSVGERQRLALVAATAHRPPVWLLDEPTRGMDATARRWVACHLLAHAAAGGVALVATHDPALAAATATHRLRLDLRTGPTLVPVARDAAGQLVADPSPVPRGVMPGEVQS